MAATQKHGKILQLAKITVKEISDNIDTGDEEDWELQYEQICELVKKVGLSIDRTKDQMLDEDKTLEEITSWSNAQKEELRAFRDLRATLRNKISEKRREETDRELQREIEKQRIINEETVQARLREQREMEEASIRQIQREEEWITRKLQLEKEARELTAYKESLPAKSAAQAVKLQKYTITPFSGDYKDWIRFWNQFEVEVDGSSISDISKFHYLLELTKGKPREDILGLPHTVEGYNEAKRILQSTYGKDIKVHKALIKEIESLHPITNVNKIVNIHDFYNKLSRVVRTLATMKKLDSAQSTVYTLMDKLGPVREIIAQGDDEWEEWKLEQLTENLRKYVDRNPMRSGDEIKPDSVNRERFRERDKLLLGNNQNSRRNDDKCVYCGNNQHKSSNCTKVLSVASRREILKRNKLCYNCTGSGHSASTCKSRNCLKCGQKHHTSICEKQQSTMPDQTSLSEKNLSASNSETTTIHATVKAKVNGQDVRIMIDTGASSSYICSDLVTKLSLRPTRKETKCIEQMYGTVTKRVEIYRINVTSNAVEGFSLDVDCINAEKPVLTHLPNPKITELKRKFQRLKRIQFSDEDSSDQQLPVHIIFGAAEYQRIRSTEQPIVGVNPDTDPGAEFTMLGWMLFGRQILESSTAEKGFFVKSSQKDFEQLCNVDVLGLTDPPNNDSEFHEDFTQHLLKKEGGYYETRLPWKADHPDLPRNKELAMARLRSTTRRLEMTGKLEDYHDVMQEHIQEGIIEKIPQKPSGETVHYIPHQAVIREDAESTKLRIVYDCSAKQNPQLPSLNDCLETGPALQPLLFDIILRNRMKRYCITGDIRKAFLQIRINEQDRDAQRILWYDNLKDRNIMEYRFTRVIFGAGPSPYILGATLQKHVLEYKEGYPETANALLKDTYVDDIQYGGDSVEELTRFKDQATEIMKEGGFTLHKWHSNVASMESTVVEKGREEEDGVKQQTNSDEKLRNTSKILGIKWDKEEDLLQMNFKSCFQSDQPVTKRKMLAVINGIFDLLGWVSPVSITAKILFSELCLEKVSWDENLPEDVQRRWNLWIKGLKACPTITIPRSIVNTKAGELSLHGFADASKQAVCAAVYLMVTSPDGMVDTNLLVAKSRISPKNTTIPRLELVAAHTLAKLLRHVTETLSSFEIDDIHLWSDSTTTLFWLASKGTWSQYVRNRVKAIHDLGEWQWHYVPTDQNPSDLGTRGVPPAKLDDFWFKGPQWLSDIHFWPIQPEIAETEQAARESLPRKKEQTLMVRENGNNDRHDWGNSLIQKFSYWKLLRVTALVKRFADNCRVKEKRKGPITTEEISSAETFWLRFAQENQELNSPMELRKDDMGVWRCFGRVPGYHPAFLPRKSLLSTRIIQHCHKATVHGGVQSTMVRVREQFWIPQLRQMVKAVCFKCNGCKKHRAKGMPSRGIAALPSFRAEFCEPFATTGVDFAGPLYYKANKKQIKKAYIVLFTCSSTRAVHLTLCKDMTTEEFKKTLKWFVARRGKPHLMVSDNAKTFAATKKWLESLQNSEEINGYLASQSIKWSFNLSRAPWWGGFFERLIGVMKSALSKVIGNALLSFTELEETLLDVECFMNNRPLTYLGEEFDKQVITPNIMLRGERATLLEDNVETLEDQADVAKRLKYIKRCKEQLRKRWIGEYLRALEERKRSHVSPDENKLNTGRVVLIKDSTKNKGQWRIGRVEGEIVGRDGVVRGYKIRTGSGYVVERPLQLIADLEVGGDVQKEQEDQGGSNLNPTAEEFVPQGRSRRGAKEAAMNRIVGVQLNEAEED